MIEWKNEMAGRPRVGVWYGWKGGKCPVPAGANVAPQYRAPANPLKGIRIEWRCAAGRLAWYHDGADDDITAFRVDSYPAARSAPANDNEPSALERKLDRIRSAGGYAYVATPYTNYEHGRTAAFTAASEAAGDLMKLGVVAFSPIAHSHAVAEAGMLDPIDPQFWQRQDQPLLEGASCVVVVTLRGWEESRGVRHEVAWALANDRPVFYLDPDELLFAAVEADIDAAFARDLEAA